MSDTNHFNCEMAFILKRTPYQDNKYLLDLFCQNLGLIRTVGSVSRYKNYRDTQSFAPFQEIMINGKIKNELATIWNSELRHHYAPKGKNILAAHYLNELMLYFSHSISRPQTLYEHYKTQLIHLRAENLRQLEWYFIEELGLFPGIKQTGAFYQLCISNPPYFTAANCGYSAELIDSLAQNQPIFSHPQLQHLLQSILHQHMPRKMHSANIARSLKKLLSQNPTTIKNT